MKLVHKYISGGGAVNIAASIEAAVRNGKLCGGEQLPAVRDLASQLKVSPATVAAAYHTLKSRGLVFCQGRRGTRICHRPVLTVTPRAALPGGTADLSNGNPDPELLPEMSSALARIDSTPRLYGQAQHDSDLVLWVRSSLDEDGVAPGPICVVNGAMDGIERVLAEHLRPGDRVAVEDPGFNGMLELVMSRSLQLEPVAIDEAGLLPEALARACQTGLQALIITPRAQNPTGAAMNAARARELRRVLRAHPDLLIIEDDHAPLICETPLEVLHDARRSRWAHVRSYSKALNPDLRLAVLTGDEGTMRRVQERLVVGERWVSHILQRLTRGLLTDDGVRRTLQRAATTYVQRREALLRALDVRGVRAVAPSGYNVWIPVAEETPTVQAMLAAGWGVTAGERFRIHAPSAIRITTSRLAVEQAGAVAGALAAVLQTDRRLAHV